MPINEQRLTADLLKPLQRTSAIWFAWVLLLVAIVGAGAVGFAYQTWQGFGITGIKWPIYWGFFITNFVFWIGISHAGTLISAILRMVQAEWRRPVTRCAEVTALLHASINATAGCVANAWPAVAVADGCCCQVKNATGPG